VYVDLTLNRSKVKVKVTGLLNFRQLAQPCMLAGMTAAPLRGFLVMSWAIKRDFKWHLKLYKDKQFLMEIGMEFHVAGEL